MPTVHDVILTKGTHVHTIAPSATVLDAVRKMNQQQIGALVVTTGGGDVAGMFTERDVLRRVLGENRNIATTEIQEVMTQQVICCRPDQDLDEVSQIMKDRRVRHVPVCVDNELQGMVSIGDVNAFHATNQEATIHFLNEYIYGRA